MDEFELAVETEGDAGREAASLEDWIRRARIEGVKSVDRKTIPPRRGEMGSLDPDTLQIIATSAAPILTMLVASMRTWIKTRPKKATIVVKSRGKEAKITSENIGADDLEKLLKAMD